MSSNGKVTPSRPSPVSNKWILRPAGQQPHPNPKLRLICIPHAGSGAYVFHAWKHLPDGVEVLPIEIPGRNTRRKEPRPNSLPSLAKDIIEGIKPLLTDGVPFAICGHSLGSWTTFALTQELQAQGGPLPLAIFVSGVRAPHLAGVQHDPDGIEMHKLGYKEFWKVFEKRYGLNKNLEDPDLREMVFPEFLADFKLGETYRPVSTTKLPCPVFASGGSNDTRFTKSQMEAWKYWVEGTEGTLHYCEVQFFPGGHHYLFTAEESEKRFEAHLSKRLEYIIAGGDWDEFQGSERQSQSQSGSVGPGDRSSAELPVSTVSMQGDPDRRSQGAGPGSARSVASDAGATVASGSSYAAWGSRGTVPGNDSSMHMMRSGWSGDAGEHQHGGDKRRKSWLGNCLCW